LEKGSLEDELMAEKIKAKRDFYLLGIYAPITTEKTESKMKRRKENIVGGNITYFHKWSFSFCLFGFCFVIVASAGIHKV